MVADVACATATCAPGTWVLAANIDYCFPPHFSLLKFVEATFVSGRVTVCAISSAKTAETDGAGLIPDESVHHAAHTGASSSAASGQCIKITSVSVDPSIPTPLKSVPIVGLPPAAVDAIHALSNNSTVPCASFEQFLALHTQSAPVTGFEVSAIFSVRSLKDLLFTDCFFAHWKTRVAQAARVRLIAIESLRGPLKGGLFLQCTAAPVYSREVLLLKICSISQKQYLMFCSGNFALRIGCVPCHSISCSSG
jgi:hypothetical protein